MNHEESSKPLEPSQPLLCNACGGENLPGYRFCGWCGARLVDSESPSSADARTTEPAPHSPRQPHSVGSTPGAAAQTAGAENRIATVLFADMAGSVRSTSSLTAEEAADLVNRVIGMMVDTVSELGGRVDRLLGDGVLAVFGTPRAREDDPQRAVAAALRIRDEARRFGSNVTCGINTGDVYFGRMGSERHSEVTVMGPTVNLAARLQGAAESDQVLIGGSTARYLRSRYSLKRREIAIKGIDTPVEAFEIPRDAEALPPVYPAHEIRSPFVGRDAELSALVDTNRKTDAGGGAVVAVTAEAGIGKSRLLAECQNRLSHEQHPPLWLTGRAFEMTATTTYGPIVDLLNTCLSSNTIRDAGDPPDRARALKAFLDDLVGQEDLERDYRDETELILSAMLRIEAGYPPLDTSDPESLKKRTFAALLNLVRALARRAGRSATPTRRLSGTAATRTDPTTIPISTGKPSPLPGLVIALEDLHWADSMTRAFLGDLAGRIDRIPLLLLCTARPDPDIVDPLLAQLRQQASDRFTEIRLRELDRESSGRIFDSLIGDSERAEAVRELVMEKSQGNPFFLEEYARDCLDSDATGVVVPQTLQQAVLSRIDRIDGEHRGTIMCAAVLGRVFGSDVLSSMAAHAGENVGDLSDAMEQFESRGFLVAEPINGSNQWTFRHALTQESLYRTLVRSRRHRLHEAAARAIEEVAMRRGLGRDAVAEELAYHWDRTGNAAAAAHALYRAGKKAAESFDNAAAVRLLDRALERAAEVTDEDAAAVLPEDLPAWIHETLGRAHDFAGDTVRCREHLEQALRLYTAPSPATLARVHVALARTISSLQDLGRAAEHYRQAEAALGARGRRSRAARGVADRPDRNRIPLLLHQPDAKTRGVVRSGGTVLPAGRICGASVSAPRSGGARAPAQGTVRNHGVNTVGGG